MNNDIRNDLQYVEQELKQVGQRLERGIEKVEDKVENVVTNMLGWSSWEIITHLAVAILFIYVIYLLVVNPQERTVSNMLLLLIALTVAVQIHQNINLKRIMF